MNILIKILLLSILYLTPINLYAKNNNIDNNYIIKIITKQAVNYNLKEHHILALYATCMRENRCKPVSKGSNQQGAFQWDIHRRKVFKKVIGHNINESTIEEQIQFVLYELFVGEEMLAGDKLLRTTNTKEANRILVIYYERSRNKKSDITKQNNIIKTLYS